MYLLVFVCFVCAQASRDETVLMTEVFEITVEPEMFNWTSHDSGDQFAYEASLLHAPDLPSWIHFLHSTNHRSGYLYGVPPYKHNAIVPLELLALNKRTFETKIERLNLIISEKLNPAQFEVHLKIDNLNVEDMFSVQRMNALKEIFTNHLWKNSQEDLYVTRLNSAIEMGARKPLNPREGEGVVIQLGTEAPFSDELLELQEEVRPLYKLDSCPRDYKRTSVERLFRDSGFQLDWCSFRLNTNENNKSINENKPIEEYLDNDQWKPVSKFSLPLRQYNYALAVTLSVSLLITVLLVLIVSYILCCDYDDIVEESKTEENNGISSSKSTDPLNTLRSDMKLSPDLMHLTRCHNESPNSTMGRGVHCRPSPPPYIRPKFKPEI